MKYIILRKEQNKVMTGLDIYGLKNHAKYFIIDGKIFAITNLQMGVKPETASLCLNTLLSYFIKLNLSEAAAKYAFRLLIFAVDDAVMFIQKGHCFYLEFSDSMDGTVKSIQLILTDTMLNTNEPALELTIITVDGTLPDRETVS